MTSPTSSIGGNRLTLSGVLAVETSGVQGSLALDGEMVRWTKKAIHSEVATLELQELLDRSGKRLGDIQQIVVNAGPGSFTGIRVGLNLARTLAFSLSVGIKIFNTLELLAGKYGQPGDRNLVAIRAVRNFYYCAGYEWTNAGLDQMLAPQSLSADELGQIEQKDYSKVLIEGETKGFDVGLEASLLLNSLDRWPAAAHFSTWKEALPIYIRASEAEEKLLKGLLKT